MTATPDLPAPAPTHDELAWLWNRVIEAREANDAQRRTPVATTAWRARADLLFALEEYAACLQRHRRPIPYALRDELRLRRLTR